MTVDSNNKGLFDNLGLIDTLIVDCNDAIRCCVGGQYVAFCNTMVQIVQKLANLKVGVKNDLENREQIIKDYETRLAELGHPIKHLSAKEVAEMTKEREN